MAVLLTVSESIDGAALNDAILGGGGGQLGSDMGQASSNSYTPLVDRVNNLGSKSLYIRHDAVTDPITSFSMYVQQFGVGTGYGYGGDDSAANDLANLIALGSASGVSKNNNDGFSGGLWAELEALSSNTNQFDIGPRPDFVKIFGKASAGIDLNNNIPIIAESMVYDAGGGTPTNGTSPVDGKLGIAGDTVLGDNANIKFRFYVPNSFLETGVFQWETVFTYAFTG